MNDATAPGDPKNSFRMDVGSNPSLKAYFTAKPDGEKCKLELELLKVGMTGDVVIGSVVSVAPEDYEEPVSSEATPPGGVKPDGEEPVMMLMGAGGGK